MSRTRERKPAGAVCIWFTAFIAVALLGDGGVARAQTDPNPPPRALGATSELATLMLVRSNASRAVVRFGEGPLDLVAVGDTLGREKARITRIGGGVMVLVGTFPGKDGKPVHGQIVIRDGERGGKRYLAHPDEPPSSGRLKVIEPGKKEPTPKKDPAPKKPSVRSETP